MKEKLSKKAEDSEDLLTLQHAAADGGTPFRETLEPSGLKEWIKKFKDNPDKIVRTQFLFSRTREGLAQEIRDSTRSMAMFDALHRRYGIALPNIDRVIGTYEGEKQLFYIVDRIHGTNLDESVSLPPEAEKKLVAFYAGIAKHYFDVSREGGDYWHDFRNDQIVWGHISGQTENNLYIVDVDQSYTPHPPGKRLLKDFKEVLIEMRRIEPKIVPTPQFHELENLLVEIVNTWGRQRTEERDEYLSFLSGKLESFMEMKK